MFNAEGVGADVAFVAADGRTHSSINNKSLAEISMLRAGHVMHRSSVANGYDCGIESSEDDTGLEDLGIRLEN